MDWYVRKTAMQDPNAHVDDTPPFITPHPDQLPMPDVGDPPGIKLRPGRKKGKGLNLWRKNRQ